MRRIKPNPPVVDGSSGGLPSDAEYINDENELANQTSDKVILLKDGKSILYEKQDDGSYKLIGEIGSDSVELSDITYDEVDSIWKVG